MIFIDANIYLRFFDSNQKLFKQLLEDLLQVKEEIFMTQQIVDEVNRNKLSVFRDSVNNYKNKIRYEGISLPEHLATQQSNQFDVVNWNKERKKLKLKNDELTTELENIIIENLNNVSNSTDNVSQKLKYLFDNALNENENELFEAKKRKEKGNPPGKNNDPLGDQITWEQLLNRIENKNEIWIISNDTDYFTIYNKQCFLNPFLISELRDKNSLIKINCFNTLSDGLQSFFDKNLQRNFPSKKQIEDIKVEERSYQRSIISSSNLASVGYDKEKQILEIEFNHGGVYQYFDVPVEEYERLMSAGSHGLYFHHKIKNDYEYSKLNQRNHGKIKKKD